MRIIMSIASFGNLLRRRTLATLRDWATKKTSDVRQGPRGGREDSVSEEARGVPLTEVVSVSSTETLEREILLLRAMSGEVAPPEEANLSLQDAFGSTSEELLAAPPSATPVLVVEVVRNGITQRYLIPQRFCGEDRWQLRGRRVLALRGHAFLEVHGRHVILRYLLCSHQKAPQAHQCYFRCQDCEFACPMLNDTYVTDACPCTKIMTKEMNFPYDPIEERYFLTGK